MSELSCQQSKYWLLITAFASLDEATECFVVFKFYWFSQLPIIIGIVSFGSSQKIWRKTFYKSLIILAIPRKLTWPGIHDRTLTMKQVQPHLGLGCYLCRIIVVRCNLSEVQNTSIGRVLLKTLSIQPKFITGSVYKWELTQNLNDEVIWEFIFTIKMK